MEVKHKPANTLTSSSSVSLRSALDHTLILKDTYNIRVRDTHKNTNKRHDYRLSFRNIRVSYKEHRFTQRDKVKEEIKTQRLNPESIVKCSYNDWKRTETTRTMNRFSKVFKSQAFCRNAIVALLHFDSDGVRHDSGDDENETRRRCYRGVVWSRTQAPPCSIAGEWRPQSGGRSSRSSKGETHRWDSRRTETTTRDKIFYFFFNRRDNEKRIVLFLVHKK